MGQYSSGNSAHAPTSYVHSHALQHVRDLWCANTLLASKPMYLLNMTLHSDVSLMV